MRREIKIILLVIITVFLTAGDSYSKVSFERLNGTDLGMGTGARAIGLGGAFVSIADDASAVFWNPAGLTQIKRGQLLFSADLPEDFSSAALVFKPPLRVLEKIKFTLGVSLINKLSFKGDSGNGTWDGYPSHLLDLSMIDIGDDFSGSIDSKTYDTRISLSFVCPRFKNLSIGVNILSID